MSLLLYTEILIIIDTDYNHICDVHLYLYAYLFIDRLRCLSSLSFSYRILMNNLTIGFITGMIINSHTPSKYNVCIGWLYHFALSDSIFD